MNMFRLPVLLLFFLAMESMAVSQYSITLRRTFVDSMRNVVTINGKFLVDKAHAHPNSAKKDGDMHIAGRNKQIGLPLVAEIMNAADYPGSVKKIHSVEGKGTPIDMRGVWRLWFEHPSKSQVQTDDVWITDSTNPNHNFEIHPVLFLDNTDLTSSLKPIQGFDAKDPTKAFDSYSNATCTVTYGNDFVTIESKKMGYNYVEFTIKITAKPKKVYDGVFTYADVYDGNTKIAEHIRMAFPRYSEAEKELRSKNVGSKMNVLGIPRVNLNTIYEYKLHHQQATTFTAALPFEMVIVATEG